MMQITLKMTLTLANGDLSESTQQEISNEYQHDRVKMIFKNLCVLVLWTEVALAIKGLSRACLDNFYTSVVWIFDTFENNFGIEFEFKKYLKENCWLCPNEDFSLKCFRKFSFLCELLPKLSGCFLTLPLYVCMG